MGKKQRKQKVIQQTINKLSGQNSEADSLLNNEQLKKKKMTLQQFRNISRNNKDMPNTIILYSKETGKIVQILDIKPTDKPVEITESVNLPVNQVSHTPVEPLENVENV
jgi:hypothetical protein